MVAVAVDSFFIATTDETEPKRSARIFLDFFSGWGKGLILLVETRVDDLNLGWDRSASTWG